MVILCDKLAQLNTKGMIVGILSMSLSNEGCRPIQKVQLINKVVAHKTM